MIIMKIISVMLQVNFDNSDCNITVTPQIKKRIRKRKRKRKRVRGNLKIKMKIRNL
jgi:hypothetical protein